MSNANGVKPVTDGFGRPLAVCLVHDDGHAGMVSPAVNKAGVAKVEALCGLLAAIGVKGWRIERMTYEVAVRAQVAALSCPVCALELPCGCPVPRVLARQCPHASAHRVHRIAHETGYCSNDHPPHVGPPL